MKRILPKTMEKISAAGVLRRFFFLLPIIVVPFLNCCNEDDAPDCGCKGSVGFTIEDSDEQTGYLYENADNTGNNVPDYSFAVWFDEQNCSNCVHKFLICNDEFLSDFGNIPAYPGIEIKFSGHAKKLCVEPFKPADYTYNHLTLTKIERI